MPVSSKRKSAKKVRNKRILTRRTSSWVIIKEARASIEMISRAVAGVATIMRDADTLNIPEDRREMSTQALRDLAGALVWTTEPKVTLLMRAEEIYSAAVGVVEQSPYVKESQLHDHVNEMYTVLHRSVQPILEPFAILCDTLLAVDNLTEEHTFTLNNSIQFMTTAHNVKGATNINPAAVGG